MIDRHHLLPRWRETRLDHERRNAKLAHNEDLAAANTPEPLAVSKLPGDPLALRGIPAIGRGVTGAIAGTRPEGLAA